MPNWKVGDTKTAFIEKVSSEVEVGESDPEEVVESSVVRFEVKKDTEHFFVVQVTLEDVALRTLIEFYKNIEDEEVETKDLSLLYNVDKISGQAELVNWQEVQAMIQKDYDNVLTLIHKVAPETNEYTATVFGNIKALFETKESIEAAMMNEIDFILEPFQNDFIFGDTVVHINRSENPFKPTDSITQITKLYLANFDSEKSTCEIHKTIDLNLTEFKQMMTDMMLKFVDAENEEEVIKMKNEIDLLDFKVHNRTAMTYDMNTTWPLKVVKEYNVKSVRIGGAVERNANTTIRIE